MHEKVRADAEKWRRLRKVEPGMLTAGQGAKRIGQSGRRKARSAKRKGHGLKRKATRPVTARPGATYGGYQVAPEASKGRAPNALRLLSQAASPYQLAMPNRLYKWNG